MRQRQRWGGVTITWCKHPRAASPGNFIRKKKVQRTRCGKPLPIMSFQHATLASLFLSGFSIESIAVEAVVRPGLPQLRITGMSAGPARDTAERLRAVIHALGIRLPATSILLHLAPQDLPKRGAYLDLALLCTLLVALRIPAAGTLLHETWDSRTLFLGEVSLDGRLRRGRPLLPLLAAAREHGFRRAVLPRRHVREAQLCGDLSCVAIDCVGDLLRAPPREVEPAATARRNRPVWSGPILGDRRLLRGVLAAAAGAHPVLMVGPPGTGKTTVAALLHALLPPLREDELLEQRALQALLGRHVQGPTPDLRPLRCPHHTVTLAGLLGGGRPPLPGEVTLAHGGLLFLDELGEVHRETLQSLREPLESGRVHLARGGAMQSSLPARFWFAAASNPCPCGFSEGHAGGCTCRAGAIRTYLSRIRGPLEDRIDVHLHFVLEAPNEDTSPDILELYEFVDRAEAVQAIRYANRGIRRNGELDGGMLEEFAPLRGAAAEDWLTMERKLNRRGRAGVRRLARTLADLSGVAEIRTVDLVEAAYLRDPTKKRQDGE